MPGTAVPSLVQHVRRLAAAVAPKSASPASLAASSSDEQLLVDFVDRRNEQAFAALLDRHGPMVLNVCRRILHDPHAAEDVFQATFLVLAGRAGAIRRRAALAGFLHGVAYRLAVRARRQKAKDLPCPVGDAALACDRTPGPPETVAWKEMLGILDQELDNLPERFRSPLVLCYLEGRTQDEAARQLGWSLNTLRRRVARGRELLEARLRGRGVTLSAAMAGLLASSAAVPSHLHAATLTALGGGALGAVSGSAASVSAASQHLVRSEFLRIPLQKFGAAVAAAALGVACLAYCWMPSPDRAEAANDAPLQVAAQAAAASQDDARTDALPVQNAARIGTARYRHGSRIASMGVSADGRLAVTASGFGSYDFALAGKFSPARVFDLADGRCLYSLPNQGQEYSEAVAISPDGKIAAVKDGKFLVFLDAPTGKELRRLKYAVGGGRSITNWMTFTPDGKHLAATLMGSDMQLIDVATAKPIRTFAPDGAASACVFTPDGKLMATGGYDKVDKFYCVRIWDVATGDELRRVPATRFPMGNGVGRTLAFSPGGKLLAGGGWGDKRLRLWDVASGKEPTVFPEVGEDLRSVAFAPDGKTIAAAAERIYLYDPATGKERLRIDRRATALFFNGDGSVLTGAVSGAIYRWDAASGRQLTPAAAQDSAVEQIFVSADARRLFTTDQDGNLYAWDRSGTKPPRRIAEQVERGFVASADRRLLAWAGPDRRIRLYDVAADRLIDRPSISGETVAAFLLDGKAIVTLGGMPATVRLWDVDSGTERRAFPVQAESDAGRHRLVPEKGVAVRLWDVTTGNAGRVLNEPTRLPVPDEAGFGRYDLGGVRYVPFYTTRRTALAPDAKTLAVGPDWGQVFGNRRMKSIDGRAFSPDGRFFVDWAENPFGRSRIDHVDVWDTATGRVVAKLTAGTRNGAANAAFAPDGRTLAASSADGVIRLWETATWKVRAEFRGHRDRVTALAFGPDGRLYSGGLDTVVLGWDVRPPSADAEDKSERPSFVQAWEMLASYDARAALQAQGRFLAEPAAAVQWFATRVKPEVDPDPARVKTLIADLDNADFAIRDKATAELKEMWPATAAALRRFASDSPSLEARRRAERIIHDMEQAIMPPGKLRALRAAETLEWIATPEARALLLQLSQGAPGAQLTRDAVAARARLQARSHSRR